MKLSVPELSLILLIGPSGAGKSTFARKHFDRFEVVSSDVCRGIVSNDENALDASTDAFELLYYTIAKRLKNGLLTVVDATNVQEDSRKGLVDLARQYHTLPAAIVLNLPEEVCVSRNEARSDRNFPNRVIRHQKIQLKRSLKHLKREGFRKIYVLNSEEEVAAVTGIDRDRLFNDKREVTGPFDIIGDLHGCYRETAELLEKLGYQIRQAPERKEYFGLEVSHPAARQVIFLGDLVDRGPDSPGVLRLVMSMVKDGVAWCVPGNHDLKLQRKLSGKNVAIRHGLAETLEQLEGESSRFRDDVRDFLYGLVSHYVFDDGRLVVAHAGIREEMQGRGSGAVRAFCTYGETTGEIDEFGLPVRHDWAAEYRGKAHVVYGHTPVPEADWLNRTLNIDTGCVFGGKLTALRYPEEELVSVDAKEVYCEPVRPLRLAAESVRTAQQEYDDQLDIADVTGKRIVQTRLRNNLTLREEQSVVALEVMSRFSVNPRWLIYLPPTMSPCETSDLPDYLEYATEAMGYYRSKGILKVVCEEKHMGSRAVLVVCRNAAVAAARFGIERGGTGICYTRSGRNFFTDIELETAFLDRVAQALTASEFWEEMDIDWVCLDAELMPWSAKAQALIKEQYAAVGAAARHALPEVAAALRETVSRGVDGADDLLARFSQKAASIDLYTEAYGNYCWPVDSLDDYKLAPFHILATEGAVHVDRDHGWHMDHIHRICAADEGLFRATQYRMVDLDQPDSVQEAVDWWLALTVAGGEGMVVKPYNFVAYGAGGLLQPAVKCRGRDYLRIIYGPDYDTPENLSRLKKRGLGKKRSLALREFALGVEALERFVRREPLRRVHESVFGVLALESDEVDARL